MGYHWIRDHWNERYATVTVHVSESGQMSLIHN